MHIARAIALVVAVSGAVAACHPRENSGQSSQSGQSGQPAQTEGRRGNGIRRICADDIAKYCENADRKRRCLKENIDKLSPNCKAALQAARGQRHNNDNGNNPSDSGD